MVEERNDVADGQPRGSDMYWTFRDLPVRVEDEYADPGGNLVLERLAVQNGIGQTYNAQRAAAQGLSYTPPADPPTILNEDDPQGVEIAAGFAHCMEDTNPIARILPDRVENNDLDIHRNVFLALRCSGETNHLTHVTALVNPGVVSLFGTVPSEGDIALAHCIVSDLEGVVRVISCLEVDDQAEGPSPSM
jgi:hypothetical protein